MKYEQIYVGDRKYACEKRIVEQQGVAEEGRLCEETTIIKGGSSRTKWRVKISKCNIDVHMRWQ